MRNPISSITGAVSFGAGALVLVGWLFDVPVLKSLGPHYVSMKANTAVAFMLAGAALMMLSNPEGPLFRARMGRSFAFIVMLIAGLTLSEYVFGWSAGIDELLYKDAPGAFGTIAPGRMAPTTALNFLLLGLGMALIDIRMRHGLVRPAELLALLPLIISLVSLVEYSLGLEFIFSFQKYTRMALHTTLIFCALSVGLLLSRADRGLVGALRQGMITAIERRIYAVFILSLFVLIMIGAASYFSAQDSLERSRLVDRGHQVRQELARVLSTLQDVETGMRGYVITGDARFLEPYEAVMRDTDQHHHKALEALIIAPDQKKRHDTLDLLIQKSIDHTRRVIALRKSGGHEQAVRIVKSGEGKRLMDDIRSDVSLMDAEEVRIIAARKEADLRSAARMKIAVFGGIALALLMNVYAIIVIHRDFKKRRQAEDALRRSAREMTARNRIAEVFLTVPDEEMYVRVLAIILEVMESKYGVFGYLDEYGSLVVPTMTRTVWEKCQVPDKRFVFPRETWGESSWPHAIHEKRTICLNELSTLTPEGHIAITRHISMPLIHQNEVVGLIQVANKETDYTAEDIALLELLGGAIAPVLDARLNGERKEAARQQAEEALRKSEENLAVTLQSIGDGVLVVDVDKRVVRLNPVAEQLTGWKEAEARGRAIEEVFRIINEKTRMPAAIPVEDVLKTGLIKGLANHTVLISRDGTERPIADSAAPIRGRGGELVGIVLVFRDVTAERESEKTLRRFNEDLEKQVRERTMNLSVANESLRNSEQALIIEKQRLEQACSAGNVALWDWDIESGSLEWSGNVDHMLGYGPGGFPREIKAWEEMIHPEDLSAVSACLSAHLEKAKPYDIKYRVKKKDGSNIWWHDIGSAKRDEEGNAYKMSGACTDITARERAEQALHASELCYRRLFESAKDGILILDAYTGEITDINPFLTEMLGYSREELVGRKLWDIGVLRDAGLSKDAYSKLQAEGYIRYEDLPLETKDKRSVAVEFVSNSYYVDEKKVIQCNIRDITERKRVGDALRASEERYKKLIDSTTNYIYSVKMENGRPISTMHSPGCVSTTGYTAEEYKADPYLWYRMIHEEDRQPVMERINDLLAGKKVRTVEHRIIHKNGAIRWLSDTLVPRYEREKLVAYDGLVVDITERKRLQEVELARLTAEGANKAKSDFLANMSHELRTPLNSIMGFSEILEDGLYGGLNEKQQKYVNNIYVSGKHLLNLINDILDLSKVEAGKMELELSRFLLRDELNASLAMLKEKAMKHGIKLGCELSPDADIEIEADERKLKQIMYNLLSNAVKFTGDNGSVHVAARRVQSSEFKVQSKNQNHELRTMNCELDADFMEISVVDTGIGIKPEDMPKLFKEFTQLESAYTKNYEGTGLGLALTRRLVELHNGRIWVESEFGKGSRFTFVIPVGHEKSSE